jgi:hypothetical protein
MFRPFDLFVPFDLFRSGAITGGGGGTTPTETYHILIESGDALLLESGDNILLEAA